MRQHSIRCFLFVFLSSISFSLAAENSRISEGTPWQAIFQLDNDLFSGSDRNYTNGIRFGFVKELPSDKEFDRFLEKHLLRLTGADERADTFQWRLHNRDNLRFASGVGLTQLMFTPDDPEALTASEGERPYAGWLGLEFTLHAKNDDRVSGITLTIGTTGDASFAEPSQNWVHEEISDSPLYQGWDSQVPSQPTLNFHFDHKQRISTLEKLRLGPIAFDGYYEWGGAIGNFRTDAYVGSLIRLGYNLPAIYSTPRVQLGSFGHELFRSSSDKRNPFSALAFVGVRAVAIAHDITMDGGWFDDFDTGVESKPYMGEFVLGLGLRWDIVDLSFSQSARSDEFYGQKANQRFGSVMLRILRTY